MYRLKRPWLFLPSQWAHDLAPLGLRLVTLGSAAEPLQWRPLQWRGLRFENPLGIAGGVDKNALALQSWWRTGMGFAEVGTVTPRPQTPNPGRIMDRDLAAKTIWNKMGFPNGGAKALREKLEGFKPYPTPVFVNIGKNRDTSTENAHRDYAQCAKLLNSVADVFVINISSPNTKDLRLLQSPEHIRQLTEAVREQSGHTPILIKLSPDLADDQLRQILDSALLAQVEGFILTNTTSTRPTGCPFPPEGGLSGKALSPLSERALELAQSHLGETAKDLLIVSAGGVFSKEDVERRLELGAQLVQIYSGLIYEGPGLFRKIVGS